MSQMTSNSLNDSVNKKVSRVCYLAQKASERNLKHEITMVQKMMKKDSKCFTQKVLLYLAEGSQKRHQRDMRISKAIKMFKVSIDESDEQDFKTFRKKHINTKPKSDIKLKTKETGSDDDAKKLQRGSSIMSETSNLSLGVEDENKNSSQRTRALSMGVLQEAPESENRRRLSAPEVVITPATKQSSSKDKDNIRGHKCLVPQRSFPGTENNSPTSSCLSVASNVKISQEKSSRRVSSSTFKSYSRASPLLKRLGSRESSDSRRRRSGKQDQNIPPEEIPNPILDER